MTSATDALLVAAIAAPLVIALAIVCRGARSAAMRVAPWAALPAFVLAFAGPAAVHAEQVLLGASLAVDPVARVFLVLTSSVWLAAGLFAGPYMAEDPRRARFWALFLTTACGNLGLVVAQDVASFYAFYGVMTFAAYGLVVHAQTDEARRAGRVYLVTALIGEMLLFAAFLLIVRRELNLPLASVPRAVADAPHRELVVGLLLAGFGIKAGALGLHVWLPLAHPVAPTPASAVLSGAMIKAGLLGWLRFLPLGIVELPGAGLGCVIAGFAAALYAVAVGLTQRDPKTVLAYSSVSQMGFMTVALGVALAAPATRAAAISAILFYAVHHALAKAGLFLGTGVASSVSGGWARRLVMIGLLVSALDLAGAPLSSGALAKISLKQLLRASPWPDVPLGALLSVGAVGSTLLMARMLRCLARPREAHRGPRHLWVPWAALLVFDVVLFVGPPIEPRQLERLARRENIASALWPLLAGAAIAALASLAARRRAAGPAWRIPPGDLLVLFERGGRWLRGQLAARVLGVVRLEAKLQGWASIRLAVERRWGALVRAITTLEGGLARFATIGTAMMLLVLLLLGLGLLLGSLA